MSIGRKQLNADVQRPTPTTNVQCSNAESFRLKAGLRVRDWNSFASHIDSCAPAHLKLVRFPAYSPLPIAALPSMSLFLKAPFDRTSRFCPSMPGTP